MEDYPPAAHNTPTGLLTPLGMVNNVVHLVDDIVASPPQSILVVRLETGARENLSTTSSAMDVILDTIIAVDPSVYPLVELLVNLPAKSSVKRLVATLLVCLPLEQQIVDAVSPAMAANVFY